MDPDGKKQKQKRVYERCILPDPQLTNRVTLVKMSGYFTLIIFTIHRLTTLLLYPYEPVPRTNDHLRRRDKGRRREWRTVGERGEDVTTHCPGVGGTGGQGRKRRLEKTKVCVDGDDRPGLWESGSFKFVQQLDLYYISESMNMCVRKGWVIFTKLFK